MANTSIPDEITVITLAPTVRSGREDDQDAVRGMEDETLRTQWGVIEKQVKASDLTGQINVLLVQIEIALKDTHSSVGPFRFSEFEITAGMTATGKLALFTVFGAEAGVSGGLKFVFKRSE